MSARPSPSNTAEGEARCEVHRLAATVAAHFGPKPDPVNTCVNTFRRRKAKKEPPGLCNLSGFNELAGRR